MTAERGYHTYRLRRRLLPATSIGPHRAGAVRRSRRRTTQDRALAQQVRDDPVCSSTGRLSGSSPPALPLPRFGIFGRMYSHRFRNFGISPPGRLSATGTRGSFTMPDSMASINEKSLAVQEQHTLAVA